MSNRQTLCHPSNQIGWLPRSCSQQNSRAKQVEVLTCPNFPRSHKQQAGHPPHQSPLPYTPWHATQITSLPRSLPSTCCHTQGQPSIWRSGPGALHLAPAHSAPAAAGAVLRPSRTTLTFCRVSGCTSFFIPATSQVSMAGTSSRTNSWSLQQIMQAEAIKVCLEHCAAWSLWEARQAVHQARVHQIIPGLPCNVLLPMEISGAAKSFRPGSNCGNACAGGEKRYRELSKLLHPRQQAASCCASRSAQLHDLYYTSDLLHPSPTNLQG